MSSHFFPVKSTPCQRLSVNATTTREMLRATKEDTDELKVDCYVCFLTLINNTSDRIHLISQVQEGLISTVCCVFVGFVCVY